MKIPKLSFNFGRKNLIILLLSFILLSISIYGVSTGFFTLKQESVVKLPTEKNVTTELEINKSQCTPFIDENNVSRLMCYLGTVNITTGQTTNVNAEIK
jgi:hypothetical protein